jgi:hypothetical protein
MTRIRSLAASVLLSVSAASLGAAQNSHPLPDAPEVSTTSSSTANPFAANAFPSGTGPAAQPAHSTSDSPRLSTLGIIGYYLRSTYSVRNFLDAGLIAGIPNLPSAPKQPQPPATLNATTGPIYENEMDAYGNGMDNWRRSSEVELRYRGRRAAVGLATAETRDFLGNLFLPLVLREDPRFVPSSLNAGLGSQLGHAVSSVFVTTSPGGGYWIPNFAHLLGTAGAAVMGKEIYASEFDVPQLHTNKFVYKYIGYSLAGDVATNVARTLVRASIKGDLQNWSKQGPPTEDNYYPLSVTGKLAYWAETTYSPRHFIEAGLMSGIPNVTDQPEYPQAPPINTTAEELAYDEQLIAYGNNVQAWRRTLEENIRANARRAIGGMSESETQGLLQYFVLPVVFRQEGRYIPLGSGHSGGARFLHAFSSLAVTRTNSGGRNINLSVLGGTVLAAVIAQQAYYPQLGTENLTSNRVLGKTIGFNFAADALLNLFHEILPQRNF